MEKLTCTVKRKARSLFCWDDCSFSPQDKRQKDSSDAEDSTLEAFTIAKGFSVKVDLILSKLFNTR